MAHGRVSPSDASSHDVYLELWLMPSDDSEPHSNKIKESWETVKKTATDKQVYAGFAIRTAATIIDWFWLNAIILLLLLPPIMVVVLYHLCGWLPAFLGPDPGPAMIWIAGICGLVGPVLLNWLYYAAFESSSFAATPGKLILGLRVTDVNGKPFSFWSSSIKQAMTTLLFGVPICLNGFVSYLCAKANLKGMEIYLYVSAAAVFLVPAIGYVMAIFDKKRQTVYDKMVARIVSVEPPVALSDGPVSFYRRLPGKIVLAFVPVFIVGLSTYIGIMLHRPDINPVIKEALDASKQWQELDISKVQRKVIMEHTVKPGVAITADDVSEIRVPSKDIGPDQVVCTDLVIGKRPIVTLRPGDFMSLRDLPYKKAQEVRNQIFAEATKNGAVGLCPHAKNRSASRLQQFRIVKAVGKGQIFVPEDFAITRLDAETPVAKAVVPRLPFEDNKTKVNYQWEFAGKECKVSCQPGDVLERRSIEPSGHVYICQRKIATAEIIEAKDIKEGQVDPAGCAYTVVSDNALIVGKRSTKELIPGKVIRANDLVWQ
jgi:flagella basal body P-ring formation protein FlgA/uncharacterized RDD family membrane protein YckC